MNRGNAASNGSYRVGQTQSSNKECWDSVSYLDSAFHHEFMRLRQNKGEFVYLEDQRLIRELDDFCDVDTMHKHRRPIILLGESGIGKSTFLANWLERRRKLFISWQTPYPEFIFSHVVGSSRNSCLVSNLLERILREIKEHFELTNEIPDVSERHIWQLPRFLEAASKKGRTIIVVDGLQRLRTQNGDNIMKWIPLSIPPNIRLIFTGTLNSPTADMFQDIPGSSRIAKTQARDNEGGGTQKVSGKSYCDRKSLRSQVIERIRTEAARRNWKLIHLFHLVEEDRKRILKLFLSKVNDQGTGVRETISLQLYDVQQRAIIGVPASASPHFLKIFLVCLLWAVKEGFNIHTVFESWLHAHNATQLLELVLLSMETGYIPDQLATSNAMTFLLKFGSNDEKDLVVTNSALEHASNSADLANLKRSLRSNSCTMTIGASDVTDSRAANVLNTVDCWKFNTLNSGPTKLESANSIYEANNLSVNTLRTDGAEFTSVASQQNEFKIFSKLDLSSQIFDSPSSLIVPGHKLRRCSTEVSMGKSETSHIDNRLDYLIGGRSVAPLRELLGRSLGLLYTSRHGLLLNELRFILNTVVAEAQGEHRSREHDGNDKALDGHGVFARQDKLTAFSEEQWQALLRVLRSLSVLFVRGVVLIPLCNDVLRDVIWWRYIGNEQTEQQYHHWLIRFFRFHPTTCRRVEELPWHFKRCYQWDALRQILTNLPMFQLLYTTSYKAELFNYWNLLTDGSLLNHSTTSNMSDSPACVMPFDVVKEYGRSVDNWYQKAHPTTKTFTSIVQLVTHFMYDFCLSCQRPLPQFVHAPLGLKELHMDGFLFVKNLPHVLTISSIAEDSAFALPFTGVSPLGGLSAMKSTLTTSSALVAALDKFPPQVHTTSTEITRSSFEDDDLNESCRFYFYYRWIWIQFPWLALGCDLNIRDGSAQSSFSEMATSSSDCDNNTDLMQASLSKKLPPFTLSHGSSDPNMIDEAKCHGCSGAVVNNGMAQGSSKKILQTECFEACSTAGKTSIIDPPATQRSKGVAKCRPVSIKTGLQASALLSPVNKTFEIRTLGDYKAKNIAHTVKSLYMSSVNHFPSAALKFSASLPTLSKHHISVQKAFLSSDSFDKHESRGQTSHFLSKTPAAHRSIAASVPTMPANELQTNGIEFKERFKTEDLRTTSFCFPSSSKDFSQIDWETEQSHNYCVITRLQGIYEAARSDVARKEKHLHNIIQRNSETLQRYEVATREYAMTQHAVEEMNSRLVKLRRLVKAVDHQEKRHRKLIRGCEMFPTCAPTHFEANKKQLRLIQLKLRDQYNEKKALQTKKLHLRNDKLSSLREAVIKSKQLISAVVDKLEHASKRAAHDQESSAKLYQRQLEMFNSVQKRNGEDYKYTMEEGDEHTQQAISAPARLLATQIAHQQTEVACERIQEATGILKMEILLQKFTQREELNASLEEQANLYEARLKQIKFREIELKEQLRTLELSQATAPSEDPRKLEQRLRAANVELARTDSAHTNLLSNSKEVYTGVARIVKLMDLTNCNNSLQNAISTSRLWPPPIGYNGNKNITFGIERLETSAITAVLQLCQNRATVILDTIDGGRSLPDINMSPVTDMSSSRRWTARGGDDRRILHNRYHQSLQLSSVTEKNKYKIYDRGGYDDSLPLAAATIDIKATTVTQHTAPDEQDSEEAEAVSREAIKATSRKKVAQRKRARNNVGHQVAQNFECR
ncbi:putative AAA+ ATPase domain, P-loop containing nucleoside triphosphate hydrolase [Plasmopara halstedii]